MKVFHPKSDVFKIIRLLMLLVSFTNQINERDRINMKIQSNEDAGGETPYSRN